MVGGCGNSAARQTVSSEPDTIDMPAFSADSAYAYVAKQVDFGPRIPSAPGHEACAGWIQQELVRHGADSIILQQAHLEGFGPMTNILARYNPQASKRILLLAHWDTRPWADEEKDPALHSKPIDGANDGASGVGVLLELARLMSLQRPTVGVDLLFVDAEDSGNDEDDSSWARGAQYFAEHLPYGGSDAPMPQMAVLLDMVGGKGAKFPRELFSQQNASAVNNHLWALAKHHKLEARFPDKLGGAINDDHLPLLRAGIPAVDIIESQNPQTGSFNPTWHTLQDNLQNIDPQTLGDVGQLMTILIYSL